MKCIYYVCNIRCFMKYRIKYRHKLTMFKVTLSWALNPRYRCCFSWKKRQHILVVPLMLVNYYNYLLLKILLSMSLIVKSFYPPRAVHTNSMYTPLREMLPEILFLTKKTHENHMCFTCHSYVLTYESHVCEIETNITCESHVNHV